MLYTFAQYSPILLSIFLVGYLVYYRFVYNILLVGSLFIIMNGVVAFLKYIIARERDPKCMEMLVRDFTFPMIDNYSMPSGHSAIAGFILGLSRDWKWHIIFGLIAFVVMFQRVIYKCHTIWECIIGLLIGYVFGFIADNHKMIKHNKHKK